MPVLVTFITVAVRCNAIEKSYPGGMTAFENDAPNRTFCTDGDLATVSFMNPFDVGNFIEDMTKTGLRFLVDGEAQDMVVVDQHQGPCNRCDWIKFGMQGPNIFLLDWN